MALSYKLQENVCFLKVKNEQNKCSKTLKGMQTQRYGVLISICQLVSYLPSFVRFAVTYRFTCTSEILEMFSCQTNHNILNMTLDTSICLPLHWDLSKLVLLWWKVNFTAEAVGPRIAVFLDMWNRKCVAKGGRNRQNEASVHTERKPQMLLLRT